MTRLIQELKRLCGEPGTWRNAWFDAFGRLGLSLAWCYLFNVVLGFSVIATAALAAGACLATCHLYYGFRALTRGKRRTA